ncbi:MAG: hypothetical protein JWR22_3441, partial [Herminiimonas sp.]|nr:hypothetical protein [Herminiimonas sp.]
DRVHSFAPPKERNQEKAARVCRPAARGSHAVGTEIGKRRKLAPLTQPPLLIRFRYRRRGGIQRGHVKGTGNGNGDGDVNGNCNCNCNCDCDCDCDCNCDCNSKCKGDCK